MTFATTSSFAVVGEAHGTQLTIARPLFQWPSFWRPPSISPRRPHRRRLSQQLQSDSKVAVAMQDCCPQALKQRGDIGLPK